MRTRRTVLEIDKPFAVTKQTTLAKPVALVELLKLAKPVTLVKFVNSRSSAIH